MLFFICPLSFSQDICFASLFCRSRQVEELAQLVRQSSHLVVYTGAGVSLTSLKPAHNLPAPTNLRTTYLRQLTCANNQVTKLQPSPGPIWGTPVPVAVFLNVPICVREAHKICARRFGRFPQKWRILNKFDQSGLLENCYDEFFAFRARAWKPFCRATSGQNFRWCSLVEKSR